MESLAFLKNENIKTEMDFEKEPMDTNETRMDDYYEEGEINSSDDEKNITVQMPSNVSSIFTKSYRKDQVGGFVTGFNTFGKDEAQKKLDRAKRFSLPLEAINSGEISHEKLTDLYRDLGIDKENERHFRFNVIHMRGTENMSTNDVLQYFMSYAPSHVEWINDVSCNVVWIDDISAARALSNLSKKIKNLDKVHLNADPFEKDFKNDSCSVEVSQKSDDAIDAREIKAAIPPGYWRMGAPCNKSSFLLLRYATRSDKKQRNAEKNSEYYKKYGNPHFGNIPGLISNSFRTGVKKSRINTTDFQMDSGRHPGVESAKRNPWEELAYEWGKTDVMEETDQKYVKSNVPRRKSSIPDLRISLTNKKEIAKRRISRDIDLSPNSSDKETWDSRSKIPRMKMYADDEEKKLEKNLEKRLQNTQFKRHPEDLRSKINRKKTKPRFKFISEKKVQVECNTESSISEDEYDDGDSGDWALEHYHDLRESLVHNKQQEYQRFNLVKYVSDSENDDELCEGDLSCRSPLQIEIKNDEYYLNNN